MYRIEFERTYSPPTKTSRMMRTAVRIFDRTDDAPQEAIAESVFDGDPAGLVLSQDFTSLRIAATKEPTGEDLLDTVAAFELVKRFPELRKLIAGPPPRRIVGLTVRFDDGSSTELAVR